METLRVVERGEACERPEMRPGGAGWRLERGSELHCQIHEAEVQPTVLLVKRVVGRLELEPGSSGFHEVLQELPWHEEVLRPRAGALVPEAHSFEAVIELSQILNMEAEVLVGDLIVELDPLLQPRCKGAWVATLNSFPPIDSGSIRQLTRRRAIHLASACPPPHLRGSGEWCPCARACTRGGDVDRSGTAPPSPCNRRVDEPSCPTRHWR